MKSTHKTLAQLSTLQKRMNELALCEESVVELKSCILRAHHLAKTLTRESLNANEYYGSHLLYLLASNARELELYWEYRDTEHQSRLFNRCQRYAVSGIDELVQWHQNSCVFEGQP